ncbi:E3 ubiquitin-protein ligase BRE1A, partial [Ophiophagus hannah]
MPITASAKNKIPQKFPHRNRDTGRVCFTTGNKDITFRSFLRSKNRLHFSSAGQFSLGGPQKLPCAVIRVAHFTLASLTTVFSQFLHFSEFSSHLERSGSAAEFAKARRGLGMRLGSFSTTEVSGTEPGARVQQAIRSLYPGPLAGWVGPFLSAPASSKPNLAIFPVSEMGEGITAEKLFRPGVGVPRPRLLSPRLKCAEEPSALSSFRAVETRLPVRCGIHEETYNEALRTPRDLQQGRNTPKAGRPLPLGNAGGPLRRSFSAARIARGGPTLEVQNSGCNERETALRILQFRRASKRILERRACYRWYRARMAEQREILAVTASSLLPTHPRLPQPCADGEGNLSENLLGAHTALPTPLQIRSLSPHPSLNCLDDPEYAASRLALSLGTRGCRALLRTPRLNRVSPEPGHGRRITLKKEIQMVGESKFKRQEREAFIKKNTTTTSVKSRKQESKHDFRRSGKIIHVLGRLAGIPRPNGSNGKTVGCGSPPTPILQPQKEIVVDGWRLTVNLPGLEGTDQGAGNRPAIQPSYFSLADIGSFWFVFGCFVNLHHFSSHLKPSTFLPTQTGRREGKSSPLCQHPCILLISAENELKERKKDEREGGRERGRKEKKEKEREGRKEGRERKRDRKIERKKEE